MNRCAHTVTVIPLLLAGCGTIENLTTGMTPFGGTKFDVDFALHGRQMPSDMLFRPVAVIDTPISVAADAVTLPITVPTTIFKAMARRDREQKALAAKKEEQRVVATPPEQDEPTD